jgi:hypothetical protein
LLLAISLEPCHPEERSDEGSAVASQEFVPLHLAKKEHPESFVGHWAAPSLLLGIYNKLVKQHGSDATSRTPAQAS